MLSASGGSRKRRRDDRPSGSALGSASPVDEFDSAAPLESQLHSLTSGREEGDLVLKQAAGCMDDLREMAKTATTEAMGEMERLEEQIKHLFVANGGTLQPLQTEDRIRLNVGGTVMSIPLSALLHPKMKRTYLSTLLLHFIDALPKDTNDLPFLEAHPPYFKWLRDQLALLESPHLDEISLHSPEADDPSYAEYHSLFMQTLGGAIEIGNQPQSTGTAANGGGEGGAKRGFRQMEQCMRRYEGLLEGLRKQKKAMEAFLVAMRPKLIVDFARRLTVVMPPGRFVHPPVVAPHEKAIFAVELGMYGLDTVPPVGEAAGASAVIRTADEWLAVMKMTDKKIAVAPSLLYKGSRDTYAFPKMLECVEGKSGLLFALRDGDTHRFGAFIDGEITPPDDPTQANWYKAPVFFFSLSGAYDAPTKIELLAEDQKVNVAGTQGVVKDTEGMPTANVCIGRGYLWLGHGRPDPAADLSRCQQWVEKDLLHDGYRGEINKHGNGRLARSNNFTSDEMEVWQVGSG
ncbi:unnamed protein product [Vitrella brassicaformis CCMP3155]|uniref:TLDc domain-containing protein n=1 Tax=Vitrella brassicaformis (strain CCMP3155) TaxID=1169540 RepID=A0A0G4EIA8_VITBC|nr:unnamed protein product [Vitrella brassicaformis CCMP3155]|eukprot:CEL95978.1 unnamed protein product [Vitrella brassicaformis CCMP3155]